MIPLVSNVNQVLAILTVIAQAVVVLLILIRLFGRRDSRVLGLIADNSLGIAFVVALVATLGSLFFSEVAEFAPCQLCWYQRIFMYPLVVLLGIAWWREDWGVRKYVIPMSVIGWLIAGFHYYEQITPTPLTSCSASGFSVSCSENFIMSFGYITIPMMTFTAFLLITVLMFINNPKAE